MAVSEPGVVREAARSELGPRAWLWLLAGSNQSDPDPGQNWELRNNNKLECERWSLRSTQFPAILRPTLFPVSFFPSQLLQIRLWGKRLGWSGGGWIFWSRTKPQIPVLTRFTVITVSHSWRWVLRGGWLVGLSDLSLQSLESCEGGVDISQLTGAPISYNPLLPSHPEEYELQYLPEPVPQYNHGLYYYNTTNTTSQQQMFLPPLPPLPQYNLVQQESVQFVPYYYYYPVPDTATPLPPVSSTQTEISQPVSPHPTFISSSSCDSSSAHPGCTNPH